MNWRARSLCLPVLAAAGLGCLTGLAISGGGRAEVRIAAATTTTPAGRPLKPAARKKPAAKKKPAVKGTGKLPPKQKPKTGSQARPGYSLGLGPRGAVGPVGPVGPAGPSGPQGPVGPVNNAVRSLTINWRNGAAGLDPVAVAALPGLGTLTLTCTPQAQTLSLAPAAAGPRTVLDTDTVQGAGTQGAASFARGTSQSPFTPIVVPVPNNGMILATISVEPYAGDGGPGPEPATMTLSSQWKMNDPDPTQNFCFIAAQFVGRS